MLPRRVDMVDGERAAGADVVRARRQHEVIDRELAAAAEQVAERARRRRGLRRHRASRPSPRAVAGARRAGRRVRGSWRAPCASSALRASSHSSRETMAWCMVGLLRFGSGRRPPRAGRRASARATGGRGSSAGTSRSCRRAAADPAPAQRDRRRIGGARQRHRARRSARRRGRAGPAARRAAEWCCHRGLPILSSFPAVAPEHLGRGATGARVTSVTGFRWTR